MDEHDDLTIIELDVETARPTRPSSETRSIGTRRRRIGAVALVAVVATGAVVVAALGHSGHHDTARSHETIVLPTGTVSVPTPSTIDANAEFVGAMGAIAPGSAWVLNGTALYRTVDGGRRWTTITPGGLIDPIGHIDALTFLDADHAWVAASAPPTPFTIWRTTDGGHTWVPLRDHFCVPTTAFPSCAPTTIDFLDPQRGWAMVAAGGSAGQLLTTRDGGATWAAVGITPFAGAVHFVDERDGWAENASGVILSTNDGGLSWSVAAPANATATLIGTPAYFGADTVVAASAIDDHSPEYVVVRRSTDGGRSWTTFRTPLLGGALLHPASDDRFVATSPSDWMLLDSPHLYITTDGGRHWTTSTPTGGTLHEVAFASPRDGWVLANPHACTARIVDCPAYYLYATVDGGATWQLRSPSVGITAERSP